MKIDKKIDKCNVCIGIETSNFPLPSDFHSEKEHLNYLIKNGIQKKWGNNPPLEIHSRIDYELDIIKEKNFCNYFLIIQDIVKIANKNNILLGSGRGSACGSLINYVLGITKINPIEHNLLFERFIDPDTDINSLIEIDAESMRRELLVKEIAKKYKKEFNKQKDTFCFNLLGLKVLSIVKDCIVKIKDNHNVIIDIDNIPMNDEKTFKLFAKGDTDGVFQFESNGIKDYLKSLKPDSFNDLVAMNAMYRPGIMQHIPTYSNLKKQNKKIEHTNPIVNQILDSTHGMLIYQEQLMLIFQKNAGFSGAESNEIRIAMRENFIEQLKELKQKYILGAQKNGFNDETELEEIWNMCLKSSELLFMKSHAVAYTTIAYQTAYLKAHYPKEFNEEWQKYDD